MLGSRNTFTTPTTSRETRKRGYDPLDPALSRRFTPGQGQIHYKKNQIAGWKWERRGTSPNDEWYRAVNAKIRAILQYWETQAGSDVRQNSLHQFSDLWIGRLARGRPMTFREWQKQLERWTAEYEGLYDDAIVDCFWWKNGQKYVRYALLLSHHDDGKSEIMGIHMRLHVIAIKQLTAYLVRAQLPISNGQAALEDLAHLRHHH